MVSLIFMALSGYRLLYVSRLPFVVTWRILFKIREIPNTSTLLNLSVLPLLPQPFLDMHLSSLSLSRVSKTFTTFISVPRDENKFQWFCITQRLCVDFQQLNY